MFVSVHAHLQASPALYPHDAELLIMKLQPEIFQFPDLRFLGTHHRSGTMAHRGFPSITSIKSTGRETAKTQAVVSF